MSNTTVSVTVTDPTNQAWANGEISFRIAANKPVFFNDVELTDNYFELTTIELDSTGSATFSLPDCAQLRPAGTPWQITVNPNAYTTGITLYLYITGSTDNISAAVNAAIAQPIVLPLVTPFAYLDSNIELQTKVGEMYWNVGTTTPGLRLYDGTEWITIGGGSGVTKIVAGDNVTISPTTGVGVVTINATESSGGITGLNGDVLAGVSPYTDATCIMVHASDDQHSLFYIDTETPPENTTHSVGLFARNVNGSDFLGSADIYYDNDDWATWILRLQFWANGTPKTPADISYILDSVGLWFLNNYSGLNGSPQFNFGGALDGTGQTLGIYYNSSTPPIWQIGTKGSANPTYLALGNSTDDVQLTGRSFATLAQMFTVGGQFFHNVSQASQGTIAAGALNGVTNISGTNTISTITPQAMPNGSFTGLGSNQVTVITATGAWSINNAGNITTTPFTAIVGHQYLFVCSDGATYQIYDITRLQGEPSVTNQTGSRAFSTQYQNTSKQMMQVTMWATTTGSSVGNLAVNMGPISGSLNNILNNGNTASVGGASSGLTFLVPPGWYYSIVGTGDFSAIGGWWETLF